MRKDGGKVEIGSRGFFFGGGGVEEEKEEDEEAG